jgi:anti-sigma regulatory factor (Ser/Thr protein kinase)
MKPDIELALPARAENIAIVRHALGGLGEVFALSEQKLSDIRLAVTEACSNAVMHAYPVDSPGMMEVSTTMVGEELSVVVRDWGAGIRPRPDSPGLGLGLSLMAALAESVQLGHDTGEHTEIRMTFALNGEEPLEADACLDVGAESLQAPSPKLSAVQAPSPELSAVQAPSPELSDVQAPSPDLSAVQATGAQATGADGHPDGLLGGTGDRRA